eukprot:scaffold5126_cov125-Isochrysis_galbana.AAC.10
MTPRHPAILSPRAPPVPAPNSPRSPGRSPSALDPGARARAGLPPQRPRALHWPHQARAARHTPIVRRWLVRGFQLREPLRQSIPPAGLHGRRKLRQKRREAAEGGHSAGWGIGASGRCVMRSWLNHRVCAADESGRCGWVEWRATAGSASHPGGQNRRTGRSGTASKNPRCLVRPNSGVGFVPEPCGGCCAPELDAGAGGKRRGARVWTRPGSVGDAPSATRKKIRCRGGGGDGSGDRGRGGGDVGGGGKGGADGRIGEEGGVGGGRLDTMSGVGGAIARVVCPWCPLDASLRWRPPSPQRRLASPHTNVSRAPTYSETSAVSLGDAEGAPPARNAPTAGIPTTALAVRSPSGASGDPLAWTINSGGRIHPSRALLDSRTSSTGAKAVGCPLTEEEATGGPLKGAKMAGGCGGDCATDGQEGSSAAAVQPLERREGVRPACTRRRQKLRTPANIPARERAYLPCWGAIAEARRALIGGDCDRSEVRPRRGSIGSWACERSPSASPSGSPARALAELSLAAAGCRCKCSRAGTRSGNQRGGSTRPAARAAAVATASRLSMSLNLRRFSLSTSATISPSAVQPESPIPEGDSASTLLLLVPRVFTPCDLAG